MATFAVVNTTTGEAIPVSTTARGAKAYATRNGYRVVCRVSPHSMTCYDYHARVAGKWREVRNTDELRFPAPAGYGANND